MAAIHAKSEGPHGVSLGVKLFNSNQKLFEARRWMDRRTDGPTDNGEFNSPPSSLHKKQLHGEN